MSIGVIYILRNAAFRDSLIKIGKTTRDSATRARELTGATGVPGPFEVLYEEEVLDVHFAERLIHDRLKDCRLNGNREFFQLPIANAVRVVFEVCMEVNAKTKQETHRIVLLMNGQSDAELLRRVIEPHLGGTTWIVVVYRNAAGECQIRLPEAWRVKFESKLLHDLINAFGDERIMVVKAKEEERPL